MAIQRTVERVVVGKPTSDGAGVKLTRVIGSDELDHLDPFLLLDEFKSDSADDYIAGFPDHPHRGFETVTYMLAGAMRHGDNMGHAGVIGPGGAQWMTAASGIIHSEMPQQEDGLLWGFQLWVNLPKSRKMDRPRYQNIEAHEIPEITEAGYVVRVVAGDFRGKVGPVQGVDTEPLYLDIRCEASCDLNIPLPMNHHAFVYIYQGDARVGGEKFPVASRQLAVLGEGDAMQISADGGARFILVAGKPIGEPIARYGPFVMNTLAEIKQAFSDYQSGKLVQCKAEE